MKRNMTNLERLIRLSAGAVGVPLGIVLLALPATGVLAVVLWVAIIAGGVDLLVSGAIGYCPLYRYLEVPWAGPNRA